MGESTQTIWLVDDDRLFRRLAERQAEEQGMVIELFETGRDILAADLTEPPSLIIVDKEMPRMGGVEVGEALRAKGFGGPMVLWTASPTRDVVAAGAGVGFDRVMAKAMQLKSLLAEVGMAA